MKVLDGVSGELVDVPFFVRLRWRVLSMLGICSEDSLVGFLDTYNDFHGKLFHYLDSNDKAWETQLRFNNKVKEILALTEDGGKDRLKETLDKGVYL